MSTTALGERQQRAHETYTRLHTKKIRYIDLSKDVGNLTDMVIWEPADGEVYQLLFCFAICRLLTGNPDAWRIELEVNNADLVASVAPTAEAVGAVTQHTVVANLPFTKANPITLSTVDDAVATVAFVDLVLVAVKLNDILGN